MPISGLVLSLTVDAAVDDLVAELSGEPRIDVGVPQGRRLPVVLETADSDEDRKLWDWLRSLPQVFHVDVSFIHFDETRTTPTGEDAEHSQRSGSAEGPNPASHGSRNPPDSRDSSESTSSSNSSSSSDSSDSTGSARPAVRTAAVRRSQDLSTQENERP